MGRLDDWYFHGGASSGEARSPEPATSTGSVPKGATPLPANFYTKEHKVKRPKSNYTHVPQGSIADTLAERGTRYGEFKDQAKIAMGIRRLMEDTAKWDSMADDQKHALSYIADKIARILNGDPDYDDNWRDISGYATLVLNRLLEGDGKENPGDPSDGPIEVLRFPQAGSFGQ